VEINIDDIRKYKDNFIDNNNNRRNNFNKKNLKKDFTVFRNVYNKFHEGNLEINKLNNKNNCLRRSNSVLFKNKKNLLSKKNCFMDHNLKLNNNNKQDGQKIIPIRTLPNPVLEKQNFTENDLDKSGNLNLN